MDHVGRDTFHGLLASLRGHLFRDSDFAEFCCADNGRDSVPLSLLATAFLFRSRDNSKGATAQMGNKSHLLCSSPGGGRRQGRDWATPDALDYVWPLGLPTRKLELPRKAPLGG